MTDEPLCDCNILVVEDEYFIADAMQRGLSDIGAQVVGPAASVAEALALLNSASVDGAILDIKLDDEDVFPVAEALAVRIIPFVFATGYSVLDVPPRWRNIRRFEKPADPAKVVRALLGGSSS